MTDLVTPYLDHLRARGYSPNTVRLRESILRRMDRDLQPYGLAGAATAELATWFAAGSWASKTRASYHEAANSIYRWATAGQNPILNWNPMLDIGRPLVHKRLPRPATADQVRRALKAATPRVRLCVKLACLGGMRVGEISRCKREDITKDQIWISGKGDKDRYVPTHPDIWAVVEHMPPGYLVHKSKGRPLSVGWLSKEISLFLRGIGLPLTCHRFRHTFATDLVRADVNLRKVQIMLGHATLATTEIYTLVAMQDLDGAIAKLPGYGSVTVTEPAGTRLGDGAGASIAA